jgi:acetyl esterase/lipase
MIWSLIATLLMQRPITFEQVAALPSRAPDHVIAYGSAPQHFGQLRLPKGSGRHPVVFFIHGGCYKAEYSIAHAGAFEQAIADLGYAVWSIEYRRVGDPGGGWPGTFQDIATATDHLEILAKQYPLDLTRVVASGHSAGGNSALWLAGRRHIAKDSPLFVDDPLPISGVLALAPAGDFLEMHAKDGCGGIMEPLMGGSPASASDRYAAANPGQLLPTAVPQGVIIGARDISFRSFGRAYVELARSNGEKQLRAIEIPAAGHFDVIAPTTSAWTVVIRELRELMR